MNPLTKHAGPPKELVSVIRANDSPRVRLFFDTVTGRYCARCYANTFPMKEDSFGNSYVDSDGFSCEGYNAWQARLAKHYWARVRAKELGISPQKLFQLKQPSADSAQTVQTMTAAKS